MYADSVSGTKLAGWTYDTLPGGVGLPTASTRYVGSAAYTARVTEYELPTGRPASSEVVIPAAETGLAGIYKTTYSATGPTAAWAARRSRSSARWARSRSSTATTLWGCRSASRGSPST